MSSNIEQLKERNRQELEKLGEPYQLKTYAIPEKHWLAFLSLLQENLPLLPGIAEEVQQSASERNLNEKSREILSSLTGSRTEIQRTLSVMERQVGKDHGNLSLSLRELEQAMRKEISSLSLKLRRVWLVSVFLSLAILLVLLVILAR